MSYFCLFLHVLHEILVFSQNGKKRPQQIEYNFFYTLSLQCSLWFFDKAKRLENKNRVLFIDARNYYTVVDRTLNEWSEWQLKNLQAIVHLYSGETEKYRQLVTEYNEARDRLLPKLMSGEITV